jgi:hypothetical protein
VLKGQDQQSKIRSTDVSTVWGYSQVFAFLVEQVVVGGAAGGFSGSVGDDVVGFAAVGGLEAAG